jgi:carbonic anhydrase
MTSTNLTRRRWLIAMGALGLGKHLNAPADNFLSKSVNTELDPPDANGALERLKKGNRRFVEGATLHAHENASWRSLLTETQKPFATVIGCSDSRAPPELIFDVGLGDLFTIRLAGNIIDEGVIGTVQYGGAHLHTPLVVVLGHEGCGAVDATLEEMLHKPMELKYVGALIRLIKPGLMKLDLNMDRTALLRAAVEANVRWSMRQLSSMPEAAKALSEKRVSLVGGVYELATGRVRFLDGAG